MIKFLKDISYNHECLTAFQSDPEGFLDRYETLTDQERALILSGNSEAIANYLLDRDGSEIPPNLCRVNTLHFCPVEGYDSTETKIVAQHKAYWSDLAERNRQFTHRG